MVEASLVFPHQLFYDTPATGEGNTVFLIEEYLFFNQYPFHKQKIAFHRASMKAYEKMLIDRGVEVRYIEAVQDSSDIRKLVPQLKESGFDSLQVIDPVDDWLEKRLRIAASKAGMALTIAETPLFLNDRDDLHPFFRQDKTSFYQTTWYKDQRKKRGILLKDDGSPEGGKWSFDTENRKKYPADKAPPAIEFPTRTEEYREAVQYVAAHFADNYGQLSEQRQLYPVDHKSAASWMVQFFERRFHDFGDYEDAIVEGESILHHSVLSPLINTGLLTPQQVLDAALKYASKNHIPVNSLEGFIRQIIGWREFIRGIYVSKGAEERTRNFWNFSRPLPDSFYEGSTGIPPVDITIRKVLEAGYCHHIERLMVLGNFMLLCEFDPDDVYRWFMELFIDAYDWVMVPNVYGMSQYADGGLMSTKPYISGSNYLMKMSNYARGDWQDTWDALFWRFMHVHRDLFSGNPRMRMLLSTFDKFSGKKKQLLLAKAEQYIRSLSS